MHFCVNNTKNTTNSEFTIGKIYKDADVFPDYRYLDIGHWIRDDNGKLRFYSKRYPGEPRWTKNYFDYFEDVTLMRENKIESIYKEI